VSDNYPFDISPYGHPPNSNHKPNPNSNPNNSPTNPNDPTLTLTVLTPLLTLTLTEEGVGM